jgi:molybdopterin converting factor small subunit
MQGGVKIRQTRKVACSTYRGEAIFRLTMSRIADPRTPSASITVECRLFARYAELLGRDQLTLTLPETATVGEAIAALRSQLEQGGLLPAAPLAAVNREHSQLDRRLRDGDELALLPPLAGG